MVNHGLIKPVKKREDSSFKPRQCTVKIKLMLIEIPNIMQVGTIKKEINKQHQLYFRDSANKLRNMKVRIPRTTGKLLMSRDVTKVQKTIKLIPTLFKYVKKLSFREEENQNGYDFENLANINNSTF